MHSSFLLTLARRSAPIPEEVGFRGGITPNWKGDRVDWGEERRTRTGAASASEDGKRRVVMFLWLSLFLLASFAARINWQPYCHQNDCLLSPKWLSTDSKTNLCCQQNKSLLSAKQIFTGSKIKFCWQHASVSTSVVSTSTCNLRVGGSNLTLSAAFFTLQRERKGRKYLGTGWRDLIMILWKASVLGFIWCMIPVITGYYCSSCLNIGISHFPPITSVQGLTQYAAHGMFSIPALAAC